jgi:hypothetical protein
LIEDHVSSFERLEVMRHLATASPAPRTARDLADELLVPLTMVETACADLVAADLLSLGPDGYRFAPPTPQLAATSRALCAIFDDDPLLIVSVMSALALERMQSMAARAFADAFLLRKRKGDE